MLVWPSSVRSVWREFALRIQKKVMRKITHKLPVQNLRWALYSMLVIWLLYSLARFTWLLIVETELPDHSTIPPAPPVTIQPTAVDVAQLQSFNLFGSQDAVGEVPSQPFIDEREINAQKTSLALELQGIVHAQDPDKTTAIITIRGQSAAYHVGDTLPFSHQVTLVKILVDHIILDNNGRYESLWLFDGDGDTISNTAPATGPSSQAVNDLRGNTSVTAMATAYREQLYSDPSSLSDVLKISPAQSRGKMEGYKLAPGRDAKAFNALGFKPGDIVTSINGIDLHNPSQALEVYQLMRTAQEATFMVKRNDQLMQIVVSLGDT